MDDMEKRKIDPLKELVNAIQELDELKQINMGAYKTMRGYSDKGDAGTAYLANAVKCVTEKSTIYLALAKFKYPTLSAVAMKDVSVVQEKSEPIDTAAAIKIIKSDIFAPIENTVGQEIDAMPIEKENKD